MSNIPEDSMLRRHYLTELKSQQDILLQKFADKIEQPKESRMEPEVPKFISNEVLMTGIFIFLLVVLFL